MEKNFHTVRGYQLLNIKNNILTSSMEDYLEMIYRNCVQDGHIRISQLSQNLNVRPSSSTKIVQKLTQLGLVDYKRYGIIKLTKEGQEIGEVLLKRHETVEQFLKNIGIEETLLRDTEMMEHDISSDTLEAMFILNEFFRLNPEIKNSYENFRQMLFKQQREKPD